MTGQQSETDQVLGLARAVAKDVASAVASAAELDVVATPAEAAQLVRELRAVLLSAQLGSEVLVSYLDGGPAVAVVVELGAPAGRG